MKDKAKKVLGWIWQTILKWPWLTILGVLILAALIGMLIYRWILKEPVLKIKVIGQPPSKADVDKAELIDRNISVAKKALAELYK